MKIKIDSKIKYLEDSHCSCITLGMSNYCCSKPAVTTCTFQASPDPAPHTSVLLLSPAWPLCLWDDAPQSAPRGSPITPLCSSQIWELLRYCERLASSLAVNTWKDFIARLTVQRSKIDTGLLNTNTDLINKSGFVPTDCQSPLPDKGGKPLDLSITWGFNFSVAWFTKYLLCQSRCLIIQFV